MEKSPYILKFDDVPSSTANLYAEELKNVLLDSSSDLSVEKRQDNQNAQDFGGTLILLLGTPAVIAVVNALAKWLELRNSVSLTIETPEGKIIAQNITSKDALKLAEIIQANK